MRRVKKITEVLPGPQARLKELMVLAAIFVGIGVTSLISQAQFQIGGGFAGGVSGGMFGGVGACPWEPQIGDDAEYKRRDGRAFRRKQRIERTKEGLGF
jgi:hypothetical protein